MSSIREYLEEKRLIRRSLILYPFRTWTLLFALFLSLPFVFRLLSMYEEERGLKKTLHQIEVKMEDKKREVERLKQDLALFDHPRWIEYKMMEKLGVVPKGAVVIERDGR